MGSDFFISYTSVDDPWAQWIAVELEAAGYSTVLQAWDFTPGTDFLHEMHKAAKSAQRTVAVLSPDYFGSAFSEAEWRAAFAKDPSGELGLLVPVRVRDCKPPGLLATRVWVDLVGAREPEARDRLLTGVDRNRPRPTSAVFPGDQPPSGSMDQSRAPFPGPRDDPVAGASAPQRPASPRAILLALALTAALAVSCCSGVLKDTPEVKSSFPVENGIRPAGANDEAVLNTTIATLQACSQVKALSPVHCPQSVDDKITSDVEDVQWRLHGDPKDGALIRYNGEEGRFHVLGTAVMTVSYKEMRGQPRLKLRVVHYWARVEWADSRAKVIEIGRFDDSPKPSTAKRNPNLSEDALRALVRTAFERCASVKSSPMPPECPTGKAPVTSDRAIWTLKGNPTINAQATFDPPSGLIHVVGNYTLTVEYNAFLIGHTSQQEGGEYDATISVDNSKPVVLRIQRKES
ncbi:toll/interleukin-1 receptor domain-containing protein [Plantactinospora veratri]|uniref:Toll/interleukin-1 receptor domain-containing protein n=1 Tax=Plantactinospora veratri TaxID=1436122 RepID=A0ABU7SAD7_9ACTN